MSTKSLFKALKTHVGNPHRKLVLITLADFSNELDQCWPSYQYIADRAECSKRSVFRHIKDLETAGHITIRKRVDSKGKSTSSMYTVHPIDRVTECHPSVSGVTQCHWEGDTVSLGEGDTVAYNTPTLSNLPITLPVEGCGEGVSTEVETEILESLFNRFYDNYPKKVDRAAAIKAWKKIKPSAELTDRLIEDCLVRVRYGEWIPDTSAKAYIPGPAQYLSGEKWKNEIIPRAEFQKEQDFSSIARDAVII